MAKKVRYNGGTQSYYVCTDSTKLKEGKEYEVILSKEYGWQTNYILDGIDGEFNATWFDEAYCEDKTYIAIANERPRIGKSYSCFKVEFIAGSPKLIGCTTSTVKKIAYMGNDIYHVETQNSAYIVKLGN